MPWRFRTDPITCIRHWAFYPFAGPPEHIVALVGPCSRAAALAMPLLAGPVAAAPRAALPWVTQPEVFGRGAYGLGGAGYGYAPLELGLAGYGQAAYAPPQGFEVTPISIGTDRYPGGHHVTAPDQFPIRAGGGRNVVRSCSSVRHHTASRSRTVRRLGPAVGVGGAGGSAGQSDHQHQPEAFDMNQSGLIDAVDLHAILHRAYRAAGTQDAFAAQCGVSTAFINQVLTGKKPPSPKVLAAIGMREVVRYAPIKRIGSAAA